MYFLLFQGVFLAGLVIVSSPVVGVLSVLPYCAVIGTVVNSSLQENLFILAQKRRRASIQGGAVEARLSPILSDQLRSGSFP